MSPRTNELMSALQRAARADDDGAFDMALGDLLARARRGAGANAAARALVDEQLSGALTALPSLGPVPSRASAVLRVVRAAGLVAAGVAIGFAWRDRAGGPYEPPSRTGQAAVSVPVGNGDLGPSALGAVPAAQPSNVAAAGEPQTETFPSDAARAPAPSRPPHQHKPRSQPSNVDSLRFAIEQLRKAQLFSRAGEPMRALRELDTLDARVPIEVLREEREVARTHAWCDAGQVAKAKALAASLLERAPDSAYAASLRESCAGQGTTEPPINFELLEQMRQSTSNLKR